MKSLQELQAIKDKMKATVNTRENHDESVHIIVAMATCGIAAGARDIVNKFNEEILKRDIHGVMVSQSGCMGDCKYEPMVQIIDADKKTTYVCLTPEKVEKIVEQHIINKTPITEYTVENTK